MSQKTIQLSFFIALTLGLLVVSFLVFKPYLGIIFISCVLSIICNPVYQKLISWFKGREGLAAITVLVMVVFIIIIPLVFIATSVFSEAVGLYNSIVFQGEASKIIIYSDSISSKLGQIIFQDPSVRLNIQDYLKDVLSWIIGHFDSIFAAVFKGVLGFFLMLISVYYLLRNGSLIRKNVILWSPLPDHYDEEVLLGLRSSVDAVIRGRFLVAIAQGFFLTLGFLIFGVANPILWGFVGSIASLIPALGTSLITIPASLYLFLNGNIGAGVGILIWGAVAVGLVDDALSMFILKKKIKIHPLIILFSVLGGIQFFGPIGFIAGPVLVSAFLSLLRIYPFIMSYQKPEYLDQARANQNMIEK